MHRSEVKIFGGVISNEAEHVFEIIYEKCKMKIIIAFSL